MITHAAVTVQESSQTYSARAEAREVAVRAGLDDTDVHRVGLVATEMATNLVKHAAGGGELLIGRIPLQPAVELIALDRGPGIGNLGTAMLDGHSSAGSAGTGLGAIRRLSDDFDISSHPGQGTAVLARLRAKGVRRELPRLFQVGAISLAKPGETVCGDAWRVRWHADGATLLVADGLGHGQFASDASEAAVAVFDRQPADGGTSRTLETIHHAIRHTRGAAAAIADVRAGLGTVRFSGVGNIVGVVHANGTARQAVSSNGTLGHQALHFRDFTYPWAADGLLVLHSDGLSARWNLQTYPGVRLRDPSIIAAILYRDFGRLRDDATVIVVKGAT